MREQITDEEEGRTLQTSNGVVKAKSKIRQDASNNSWILNWNNGNVNNNNRNNNNYVRAFLELLHRLSRVCMEIVVDGNVARYTRSLL